MSPDEPRRWWVLILVSGQFTLSAGEDVKILDAGLNVPESPRELADDKLSRSESTVLLQQNKNTH